MERRRWIIGYRALFGLLAIATVAFLFVHNRRNPGFSAVNFFSFFTIESNLFAAAVLLFDAARAPDRRPSVAWDLIRGAAVLYMTMTGIVYGVLLAGYVAELGTAVAWADSVVHRVMPLVMVADWLMVPPRTHLTPRQAGRWLIYPLVFVAYSLIRGPIVGWYPYPFLDPSKVGGYAGVFGTCVGIAIGVLIVLRVIVAVGDRPRQVVPAAAD